MTGLPGAFGRARGLFRHYRQRAGQQAEQRQRRLAEQAEAEGEGDVAGVAHAAVSVPGGAESFICGA